MSLDHMVLPHEFSEGHVHGTPSSLLVLYPLKTRWYECGRGVAVRDALESEKLSTQESYEAQRSTLNLDPILPMFTRANLFLMALALQAQTGTIMWFNSTNVIPLGNGRLGAQVLGQIPEEVIILNEDRIWSGSLNDPNNRNCSTNLSAFREYVWQDDLFNAQATADAECMATPISQQVYQTAGNMSLATSHSGVISRYNHSLDLATAVSTTTYVYEGVQYTRTAFASHPDNVIVILMSANATQSVSFDASFETPMSIPTFSASGGNLTMTGQGTSMYGLPGSINFMVKAEFTVSGTMAEVHATSDVKPALSISNADEALIVIAIDTNYVRYDDLSADPNEKVTQTLANVQGKTFDAMLKAHVEDHSALFGRVNISLGEPSSNTFLPTNIRKNLEDGPDADQDIFALYAQYGRYLGIASSRNTEPSNLQGIWNQVLSPDWGSKHTVNINQQMNSWFAEPLNVAETLDPLWSMISEVAERGKIDALETYNISRGWVCHHNTGIWRDSAPIDAAFYGFWPYAPAWLLQHMYEHYAFNPDPQSSFLKNTAYPLMKGLSEFYMDFLVEAPLDVEPNGYIVPNPSMSPEHGIGNYNDTNVSLTYASTIDNSLLRDLFNHTVEFATILGVDSEFAANLSTLKDRLIPFRIGSLGQIQEWARDYDSNGPFTHISQLYGLFPGAQIDPRFNETLAHAANVSLLLRGDSSSGWPTAWRANLFARLLQGETAYYYMTRLISRYSYDNLWSINSVFQIDGNFGGTNAVAEMILQSHNGEIHLLPAIPQSWTHGSVSGFRARGGFTLDIAWSAGFLSWATLTSTLGTFARVRYNGTAINLSMQRNDSVHLALSDFQ
ncbi:Six-hairpin glycosidase-like protein [Lentinula edodes]|nr:Six-hairpin glycosidase-like protein [Lentinula edodes]